MKNVISWFEIPATDIERAQKFYEAVFQIQMTNMDFPGVKMRAFPLDDPMNGVGGTIIDTSGFHKPSQTEGPLIYLNGNPDVQHFLDRAEAAGGKIIVPKREISPEHGYMAIITDTEGNRIAFHSVPEKYLQK
ncbi:MAG: VOC family protein [Sphingobacteriales bacterium]|nr:VOC family protein [Sphingobacteriales bacterium]